MVVYKGPLKDNTGKVVIPAGDRAEADRHRAREDGLPGRGRRREDALIALRQWDVGVSIGAPPVSEPVAAPAGLGARGGAGARAPAAAAEARDARRAAIRRAIESIAVPGAAICAALLLFGVFMALTGRNPLAVYREMFRGSFGTWFSFQNTLQRAAPLMLTALATALPLRLGLVVLGGEGAMVLGGLAAAAVATHFHAPMSMQGGDAGRGRAGRRRLDGARRRAARVPRRERDHQHAAAQLHRDRAAQSPGRGAAARSGEPEQAFDAADRRRQHARHAARASTSTGDWRGGSARACSSGSSCSGPRSASPRAWWGATSARRC